MIISNLQRCSINVFISDFVKSEIMKKQFSLHLQVILVSLFWVIAIFQSYSQTAVRPINGPRSEKHVTDELGRRQGVWRYYYANGDVREEINYINNLQEGVNTKYFGGKKIHIEGNYLGGRKDGDYKRYFLSGQVAIEGKYIYGQRDGIWIEYYEDGQKKSEREYKKGVKNGNWKTFSRKGELLSDITYKNGVDVNAVPPPPKKKPIVGTKTTTPAVKKAIQDTTKTK